MAIEMNYLWLEIDLDAKSVAEILNSQDCKSEVNANLILNCRSVI